MGENLVQFDDFEADLTTHELFRFGKRVRLQSKPFQLLGLLLQRAGELVRREEIVAYLWPGAFRLEDDNLNSAIYKVRIALRDKAERPKFIETVGCLGYRFIAPIETSQKIKAEPSPLRVGILPLQDFSVPPTPHLLHEISDEIFAQLGHFTSDLAIVAAPTVDLDREDEFKRVAGAFGISFFLQVILRHEARHISFRLVRTADRVVLCANSIDNAGAAGEIATQVVRAVLPLQT